MVNTNWNGHGCALGGKRGNTFPMATISATCLSTRSTASPGKRDFHTGRRPSGTERDVPALDIAAIAETLAKRNETVPNRVRR